ncbi:phage tail spike protein [Bacillus pacificus]|uniref:phage tail spike protein n=1 Tax=Bacillus pacificus TaxID=2026187 RepID=UPI003D2356CF
MRKISGDLHIVDFKTKQIIASIQPEDYFDDLRHWEIKDNVDILDFKLLEDSPFLDYIQQKNLILKETNPGVITPYVITSIEKDSEAHNVTIYASGEWILLDKENYIKPQEIKSWSAEQYLTLGITGTGWEIGLIEAEGKRSFKIEKFISPLQFIQQIATLFDNIEIQYRMEIGTGKPRRFIDLVKKRGRETNKEVTLGKDLVGIKRIENSENIITALVPYYIGQDAEGNEKLITIESVNNGVQYIVDEAAYQRWNVNGKHLFGFYTPESEKDELTPERLLTLAKTELKKRVSAIVTYEVNSVDISSVFGYEHEDVSEGDTIRIIDEGMTPTLYLEARAIVGDNSHKDKHQNKHTFGNYVEIVNQDEALRKLYQKMLSMINDKVSKEWFAALEEKANDATKKANEAVAESQTAKDLATATQKYMEQNMVDIIEQPTAPTENLRDGKTLWIDSADPENKVQKLWKDGQWQRVTPDTGPLQQSIKDAENEINTLKDTVKDMPDKTWLNQQLEGKADKSGVYTKDYIDKNLVGKQVYETDKQGNIKQFADMKTEIEQNAEAITQKAEKTQVNNISDDLKQVTQTANTAKQTADSNTSTITELKTTVNNISVGSTNLAIGSETGLNKQNMTGTWSDSKYMTLSDKINFRNKTFTISFLFTGKMTKLNSNPWFGVEASITYADGEQEYKSIRTDVKLSLNIDYKEEPLSVTFKTKDKDVTQVKFYYSGRNIEGNLISHHAKFEEGNIRTTWQPANEEVTSKADFTKTTNEIKQTVDENSQTISKVQKDQGTMQTTLNQVKQTTDSNLQTITTLSQTQGKQGEVIQQNTSDITQLNNQIKSKVTDTQMQEYLGGLGNTNLLFNAAFEDRVINATTGVVTSRKPSISKWNVGPNGSNFTAVPETARNHDGMNSVKLESSGQTVDRNAAFYQSLPVSPNSGDYVLSAWFYTDAVATIDNTAFVMIEFYNGSTWVTNKVVQLVPLLTNGSWKFVSVTMPAPASGVTTIRFVVVIRKNGRLWVSQPQLQQGITPSSFMENPKDYANYDQLVGEIAKKVDTSDFDNKVTQMETTINQQSNRIDLKAEKNDVYNKVDSDGRYGSKAIVDSHSTQLSLMSDEINLRVKSNEISSTINQTAQSVLIQASKIYLDGYIEAKHLKAQTLQGVTIQTAPAGSGANHIRLNAQNLTVYGGGRSRGYLGFIERTDGNIQSALILGNDYETTGTLNGSLVIDQTTINSNVFTNSVASIGIATGRNGNDVIKSSYINFYRYDGAMQINSIGNMSLTNTNGNISLTASSTGGTTGFITLSSSKDINFTAKRGYFNFYTSDNKSFPAMTIKDLAPTAQGDVDFTFANQIMFRMARHPDYVGDGLQIKSATGDAFRDIKLRTLRATENISATGRMWAQEFIPNSSRTLKTDIEDLPFSALDKINSVNIKQYHFIRDVERLESGESITLPINYGMIAEDTDDVFTTPQKDAIKLYSSVAISIQAIQEVDFKVKNLQFDNGMLKQELEVQRQELEAQKLKEVDQDNRIAALEELVRKLMNETSTTENTTQTEQP